MDAFLAGRGGDFDDDDDGINKHKDNDNTHGEHGMKTQTARTTPTSFLDTTTNLWTDAFLAGRGGDFDNDDDGNNAGRREWLILTRTTAEIPTARTV